MRGVTVEQANRKSELIDADPSAARLRVKWCYKLRLHTRMHLNRKRYRPGLLLVAIAEKLITIRQVHPANRAHQAASSDRLALEAESAVWKALHRTPDRRSSHEAESECDQSEVMDGVATECLQLTAYRGRHKTVLEGAIVRVFRPHKNAGVHPQGGAVFKGVIETPDGDRSRRAADFNIAISTTEIVIDLAHRETIEKTLVEIEDVPDMSAHPILRKARPWCFIDVVIYLSQKCKSLA